MSKATSQITDGDSQRNKDQKDKEDFASQNYPQEFIGGQEIKAAERKALEDKQNEEQAVVEEPKFNVNFISDEEFSKELDALLFVPQGESVIVLGPRVKQSSAVKSGAIKLSEKEERALLDKELAKHQPGYRVLAVSPQVMSQMVDMVKKIMPLISDEEEYNTQLSSIFTQLFYKSGDYVLSKSPKINQMNFVFPANPDLAYYEFYHRDISGFITQESILRLKEGAAKLAKDKKEQDETKR